MAASMTWSSIVIWATTGQAPLSHWLSEIDHLRPGPGAAALDEVFLHRADRKVRLDRTVRWPRRPASTRSTCRVLQRGPTSARHLAGSPGSRAPAYHCISRSTGAVRLLLPASGASVLTGL